VKVVADRVDRALVLVALRVAEDEIEQPVEQHDLAERQPVLATLAEPLVVLERRLERRLAHALGPHGRDRHLLGAGRDGRQRAGAGDDESEDGARDHPRIIAAGSRLGCRRKRTSAVGRSPVR
jgi:hypothetical protein